VIEERDGKRIFHCDACPRKHVESASNYDEYRVADLLAKEAGWYLGYAGSRRETLCPKCASDRGLSE
jgi:hypothetical protein